MSECHNLSHMQITEKNNQGDGFKSKRQGIMLVFQYLKIFLPDFSEECRLSCLSVMPFMH